MRKVCHYATAKRLYAMNRAWPDLKTLFMFLCTILSKSDKGDWKKSRRLLGFVKFVINDKHIIGEEGMKIYVCALRMHIQYMGMCEFTLAELCQWMLSHYIVSHRKKIEQKSVHQSITGRIE